MKTRNNNNVFLSRFLVLCSLFISIIFFSLQVQAEFICRSNVSYKWKKVKPEVEEEIFYAMVEGKAATEAEAKGVMDARITEEKKQARLQCEKSHQNFAKCLASKYDSFSQTMNTATFSARKALEESINADCTSLTGTCLESINTEVKCEEKLEATSEDQGAAGGDKKGEKGKEPAKKK